MSSISNERGALTVKESSCPISWGAIIGGAFVAAAVSLALLLLGSALGLSFISPWSSPNAESISSFTVKSAIWLIVIQWVASGLGGYLTGRLRIKWADLHTEEVFFRDTAHGLLMWAVATVLAASVLAGTATSLAGFSAKAGAVMAGNPPAPPRPDAGPAGDMNGYYVDSLFRTATPNPSVNLPDARAETMRIFVTDLKNGGVTSDDKAYLAQLVSARTGLNQADAANRVEATLAQLNVAKEKAKLDADTARRTAMHVSLYVFLSLLIGAFIASTAAAIGGRRRDEY